LISVLNSRHVGVNALCAIPRLPHPAFRVQSSRPTDILSARINQRVPKTEDDLQGPALPDDSISTTVLLRRMLDPNDEQAADGFVRRYQPVILDWCAALGLQPADADDVAQTVLERLVVAMRLSKYEKSKGTFRQWLWAVVRNAVKDAARGRKRIVAGSGDSGVWEQLQAVPAEESLHTRLKANFDLELQEEAMARVETRVLPDTWKMFTARSLDNVPAEEVAAQVKRSVAAVHMANSRVLRLIHECIQELEQAQGD
jgi:RNA polymerase sigma-70 factor (ECF subfamily)